MRQPDNDVTQEPKVQLSNRRFMLEAVSTLAEVKYFAGRRGERIFCGD